MGDFASWSERRRAVRVPVRGVAVFSSHGITTRATIENLSTTGALLEVMGLPADGMLELKLGNDSGRVHARTVRVERGARRTRIAVVFERVEPRLRASIAYAIDHALSAAERRPIVIIDEDVERRANLARQLSDAGMTPLAPTTPLEAIDMLTRTQLHVCMVLLAPSFGHSVSELRTLVADSFPWVSTVEISDDVDATVQHVELAWSGTDMGRLARAIA